jgi:ABC-2 type transport system permease protein
MAKAPSTRFFTLLQREFREYRNSLFWTPVVTAVLLGLFMLGSVVLANRISFLGDVLLNVVMHDGAEVGFNISVVGDEGAPIAIVDADRTARDATGDGAVPAAPPPVAYEIVVEEEVDVESWNFSREWRFEPDIGADENVASGDDGRDLRERELNALLSVIHALLVLILLITSANYLLGSLYDDRKDRSILFWRSMPVSEWGIVLSKFVVAMALAPLVYVAISLLLQLTYVLLMMLLVWRLDKDPFEVVVANVDWLALMLDPISGWIMTALLIAPMYAWFLLASAAARRSPFMLAVLPVVALVIAEGIFFGSEHVGDAVQRHFPHISDDSAVGFYLFGPDWTAVNLLSMGSGLVFAAAALAGAVWLRRHRWEL